ncbi:MAG: collagen-binding domain-containing protein, partial [Planctomycetota bacterium]
MKSHAFVLAFCSFALTISNAAASVLSDYNLVSLGNLTSSGEVFGSALVGGDIFGNTSGYSVLGGTNATRDGLVLAGDLLATNQILLNNGGNLRVSPTTQLNAGRVFNGGGSFFIDPNVDQIVQNAAAEVNFLNAAFANLETNATITDNGSDVILNAPAASPVTVFSIDGALLSRSNTRFSINFNSNFTSTVIVNIDGNGGIVNLGGSGASFGAGFTNINASRILFNFVNTERVQVLSTFSGAVLAPDADIRLISGDVNGTVVGDAVDQGTRDIRLNTYTGFIPTEIPTP